MPSSNATRLLEDGYDDKFRHGASAAWSAVAVIAITGGIGLLQLPYALRVGGWAAILLIPLAAVMSLYTAVSLVSSLYSPTDGSRLTSYAALAQAAFGTGGRRVVTDGRAALCVCSRYLSTLSPLSPRG